MSGGDQAFRADGLREREHEMTYGGALSFLRRRYTRDLAGVDVAVMGFPYDAAVTNRPGARLGPRAIRAASTQLAELKAFPLRLRPPHLPRHRRPRRRHARPPPSRDDRPAIEAAATEVIASGARLLALGGDHFVAYPLIRAHAARHGPLALIQFDAHGDLWPGDPQGLDHGTMMGRAIREGLIDPARSTQIGIRTFHDTTMGLEVLTAPFVHREGIAATLEIATARAAGAPAYVSFDIDVLDPAFAPGTGTPVPGGLATWQALELVRGLAPLDLVGMDLVEVSPPFDHAEITALAAAHIAHDWLCLIALKSGAATASVGRL
jgi:agmatinase